MDEQDKMGFDAARQTEAGHKEELPENEEGIRIGKE